MPDTHTSSSPKQNKFNEHIAVSVLLVGTLISVFWSLYFARITISTPYQIGFREGAPQVLTSMLIHGENPYIFENHPLAFNNYSIAYSTAVLPFALLFGNTLHIHRWVTFIFILLSTTFGFWVVFSRGRSFPPLWLAAPLSSSVLSGAAASGLHRQRWGHSYFSLQFSSRIYAHLINPA
ncbi:MAG: hypothetical protein IPJ47_08275 [Anaerolineales bacterium]|nr:hypothetical protein [Anaerolineales bacterium]